MYQNNKENKAIETIKVTFSPGIYDVIYHTIPSFGGCRATRANP